jgi:hypothetical protein
VTAARSLPNFPRKGRAEDDYQVAAPTESRTPHWHRAKIAHTKFESDGTLRYTVHGIGRDEVILLTYRVESGFIITNQPSHPRPERTAYEITADGKLVLNFGGQKSLYHRIT